RGDAQRCRRRGRQGRAAQAAGQGGDLPLPRRGRTRAAAQGGAGRPSRQAGEEMMNRAALIGACVLVAGCAGGNQDDLQVWMNEQAKTMRGAVRTLPELKQVAVVAYAGTQGDDPFRSAR